jgi:hypothetical protein
MLSLASNCLEKNDGTVKPCSPVKKVFGVFISKRVLFNYHSFWLSSLSVKFPPTQYYTKPIQFAKNFSAFDYQCALFILPSRWYKFGIVNRCHIEHLSRALYLTGNSTFDKIKKGCDSFPVAA